MKTTEQLNTFTSVDLQDRQESSNNLEFTHIENTPFTIVRQDSEYFGLIGNHRITESYSDEETLKKEIQKITWDRILQVIWAVTEKFKNYEQLKKQENE